MSRAACGARSTARYGRSNQFAGENAEHHDVNEVATLEVAAAKQPLTREADLLRERERTLVVRQRGHLDAVQVPAVDGPFAGGLDRSAADAATACPRGKPEADLRAPVIGADAVEVDAARERIVG